MSNVLTLRVSYANTAALQAAYLGFIENKGLFIPVDLGSELGDLVLGLLDLPDGKQPVPFVAQVVWINAGRAGGRAQGAGVQLQEQDSALRARIETCLLEIPVQSEPNCLAL